MTKKIFRSIIFVSIVTFLACVALILGILFEYFNGSLLDELQNAAALAEQGITLQGSGYFEGLDSEDRITWIDSDGSVLYDTEIDSGLLENHMEREEVAEAFENGSGSSQRYSDTFAEKEVYYAKLMEDGTVIRVSSSQYTVWTILLAMIQPTIFLFIIVILLSVFMASKLSKRIVKPINEIDIGSPDADENYPEISPLIKKISRQNILINRQMKELKRAGEEFMTITSNMAEGLIIIDKNTKIISYNTGALKHLGVESAEQGDSVFTLNRSQSFTNSIDNALKGTNSESLMELNDKVYEILANPVFEGDKITGAIILIVDVTEKEQRESLRREFTSNVSHELKTPLTSIYGISEIMVNGIVKPEDMGHFAETIHSESGRLINLVNDIIKLSQLDEKSITTENEPVDIFALAQNVAERLKDLADGNGIEITVEGENTVIDGANTILDEIIYNLCENAIKYNKPNGKVNIFVGRQNGKPVIRVADTGIGIPDADQPRIFERFYRVDKSHSRKIGGTGLGLSIVKHGAAYHGGHVEVESKLGEGTVFTVIFDNN
ncbi:MAG: ATP-binding protein [Clostridiales bacterium]|nr:ATP-binding protein [Clostridiales bacterium]